jgi:hypothetical protein
MKRLGFWAGLAVLALATGGALAYKPWMAYLEQRSIATKHEAEMQAAEAKSAELARQKARLDSHAGREAAARLHGYTKPDERDLDQVKK